MTTDYRLLPSDSAIKTEVRQVLRTNFLGVYYPNYFGVSGRQRFGTMETLSWQKRLHLEA
jgi:hypothetical protein